jgi:hypothetical protein
MGGIQARWVRPSGQSLPRDSYERDGILNIRNIQRQDGGVYTCEGVDQRGQIIFSARTNLIVTGIFVLVEVY